MWASNSPPALIEVHRTSQRLMFFVFSLNKNSLDSFSATCKATVHVGGILHSILKEKSPTDMPVQQDWGKRLHISTLQFGAYNLNRKRPKKLKGSICPITWPPRSHGIIPINSFLQGHITYRKRFTFHHCPVLCRRTVYTAAMLTNVWT